MSIAILKPGEMQKMRAAGKLAAETLVFIAPHIQPGITTDEINDLVHQFTVEHGAIPAPLGYGQTKRRMAFPKSVCTSLNNVVCHGIPGPRTLVSGDIINIDVTPIVDGWHGDTSATFFVGEVSDAARHVVEVSRKALEIGIQRVRPGRRIGDIGSAIQAFVEGEGCSVVREYCGHGLGRRFHTEPSVPHWGKPGTGAKLKKGMVFTIEPMVNLGGWEIEHLDDGWTVLTKDGSLSAQFEHTILVTKKGCEVLTQRRAKLVHSEIEAS